MARGEMRENKKFGTNFEDGEVLPETEEDVFQMIGFDAQKEYNPGEMTKMAREADKLCRKFKIGDYDPRRQREEESSDEEPPATDLPPRAVPWTPSASETAKTWPTDVPIVASAPGRTSATSP